jgi:hypothetical protein
VSRLFSNKPGADRRRRDFWGRSDGLSREIVSQEERCTKERSQERRSELRVLGGSLVAVGEKQKAREMQEIQEKEMDMNITNKEVREEETRR